MLTGTTHISERKRAYKMNNSIEFNFDFVYNAQTYLAGVAELVDAPDSKSGFFGSAGSIPALGTKFKFQEVPEHTQTPLSKGVFIALNLYTTLRRFKKNYQAPLDALTVE
jgi:hypothetical protein